MGVVGYRCRTSLSKDNSGCRWVRVSVTCRQVPVTDGLSVGDSGCCRLPVSDGFTYGRQCMGVVVCAGYGRVCQRTTGEAAPCSQRVLRGGSFSINGSLVMGYNAS